LLGLTSRLFAADLQLDAQLGFDPQTPLLRPNTWSPITVTLRNTGPDTEGVLRIHAEFGAAQPITQASVAPAPAPSQSPPRFGKPRVRGWLSEAVKPKKPQPSAQTASPTDISFVQEYRLTMPKNSTKQVRDIVFLTPADRSVEVEWVVKRKVQSNTSLPFQFADWDAPSVLIVGETDWVRSLKTLTRDQPRTLRPVLYAGKLEALPDNSFGYDGVDTVILDRGEWTRMLRAQADALCGFVESGGSLVVSTGREAGNVTGSPVAELLPIVLRGNEQIKQLTKALPDLFIPPATQLLLSRATPRPGAELHVIAEDLGRPIIAESPLGLGRVTFLAFQLGDPVLREWSGKSYLWSFLFARRAASPLPTRTAAFEEKVNAALEGNTLLAIPTANQIGLLLLVYAVGVIPLNHFFWQLVKRPLWAWFALPVLSLGLGVVMIANERVVTRGNLSLTEISVVHAQSGRSAAMADSFFSLQTPYGAEFKAAWSQTNVAWLPVWSDTTGREFRLDSAGNVPSLAFEVARNDSASYRGAHPCSVDGGVLVQAEMKNGALGGRVVNRTGLTFIESGLLGPATNKAAVEIVGAGATKPVAHEGDSEHIKKFAREIVGSQVDASQRVVFWGLARGAPIGVELRDATDRPTPATRESKWTLFVCDAPFQVDEGPFVVGPEYWRAKITAVRTQMNQPADTERHYLGRDLRTFQEAIGYHEIVVRVEPGVELATSETMQIARLDLRLDVAASDDSLRAELFNLKENAWEAVPGVSWRREEVLKYMHPRTGALLFRFRDGGAKQIKDISVAVIGERTKPKPNA
jgi:hypothetical protein